jgi:hypothetical protein
MYETREEQSLRSQLEAFKALMLKHSARRTDNPAARDTMMSKERYCVLRGSSRDARIQAQ